MYTKFIPKKIQEKLKAKERALAYKVGGANESEVAGVIKPQDIQSRTTFVRMCSNKVEAIDNIVISGGKLSTDGKLKFGTTTNNGLYNKTSDNQIRPVAGIKNIEVSYKGGFKAIREATVSWIVGSIQELDELTPYFLTVGKTVVLDWGWVNSNIKNFNQMFDEGDPFITLNKGQYSDPDKINFRVSQEIFTDAASRIQMMGGDYDAIGGKVSNFEMTMRPDGGFDCVTKITALGSSLFKKPINKPTNSISITPKKKEESADGDGTGPLSNEATSLGGEDSIINCLINIKDIIKSDVFGAPRKKKVGYPKLTLSADLNLIVTDNNIKNSDWTSWTDYKRYLPKGLDYGIIQDNPVNPQVCWMNQYGVERIFVKWGYMEDQIFNRYLSYDSGDTGIKLTFRSIQTKVNADGQSILNKEYIDLVEKASESSSAGSAPTLQGTDVARNTYIIESGDTLGGIAGKLKPPITLAQLMGYNPNLKTTDTINPGDIIVVPGINTPTGQPTEKAQHYLTLGASGDNLAIKSLQGLKKSNVIEAGDPEAIAAVAEEAQLESIKVEASNRSLNATEKIATSDIIPTGDIQKYEKFATKIKNNKDLLKPIDITKFWSSELLPDYKDFANRGMSAAVVSDDITQSKNFYNEWKKIDIIPANQFSDEKNESLGTLRNMWVNIEEIQKAFKIDLSGDQPTANPPATIDNAVKSLLQSLNNNFFNIWDFEIVSDVYDSTNIGVIDKKANTPDNISLKYTSFVTNNDIRDKEGNFSHQVQDLGIYKFPTFKAGSIVKNQSLAFKIPDSMALTILYGSNKSSKKNTNNSSYNNPGLMKLFGMDKQTSYDDMYLKDMVPSNVPLDESSTVVKAGSHNSKPNSKIVKGIGLSINPNENWFNEWSGPETNVIKKGSQDEDAGVFYKYAFSGDTNQILRLIRKGARQRAVEVNSDNETVYVDAGGGTVVNYTIDISFDSYTPLYQGEFFQKKCPGMKPEVQKLIRSRLNGAIKQTKQNVFKVDNIIPADLTLEIDGIGGIVPGDVVHTNYIQKQYNEELVAGTAPVGPYVYFQIVGLTQRVDSSTWTTELVSKMRINHIPDTQDLRIDIEDDEVVKNLKKPKDKVVVIGNKNDIEIDTSQTPNPPYNIKRPDDVASNVTISPPDKGLVTDPTDGYTNWLLPDVFGPLPVSSFENIENTPPDVDIVKVIAKKTNDTAKKDIKEKKKGIPIVLKSTYRGSQANNNILYDIVPNWRTRLASTTSERDNGDFKNRIIYNEGDVQAAVPVRVRAHFWNDNIEPKNISGVSDSDVVAENQKALISKRTYFNTVKIDEYSTSDKNHWYKDER